MSEIINISLSQYANHVTTHLYNEQESHIPYRKNQVIEYDNATFLSVKKNQNGTSNYSPRCLVYDVSGGMGALNKFEYYEKKPELDIDPSHTIHVGSEVKKNEYQRSLDMGVTKEGLLNTTNTKYWTDYNKLIHNPRNLHTLNDWMYTPGNQLGSHKFSGDIKFDTYNKGKEEFKRDEDGRLEDFRRVLEDCDLLQGVNITTEVDSAWGGFTNEYIVSLRDEFFNNGVSTKHSLWVNGLLGPKDKVRGNGLISRIRTLIAFSQNATLFFPLDVDVSNSGLISDEFDNSSLWTVSALPAFFINSIWSLNNASYGSTHMQQIQDNVLRGYDRRNIVNDINLYKPAVLDELIGSVDISNYYSSDPSPAKDAYIDLSYSKSKDAFNFSENYIFSSKDSQNNILNEKSSQNVNGYISQNANRIAKIDTFPQVLKSNDLYTQFNTSTGLKEDLKHYRKILSRVPNSSDLIEDKSELIETLSDIINEYSHGYSDSDEEFD